MTTRLFGIVIMAVCSGFVTAHFGIPPLVSGAMFGCVIGFFMVLDGIINKNKAEYE